MRILGDAFERLVVPKDAEGGIPQVSSETVDNPDDAASLEIERGPVSLRLEGSAADEYNKAYNRRAVLLFLLKCGPKTIYARVAVEEERAGVVRNRVPVWVDHNRWRR